MKFISFVFIFLLTIFSSFADEKNTGETIVNDETTVKSLLKEGFIVDEKYMSESTDGTFYFILIKKRAYFVDINERITLDQLSEIIEKKTGEKILELSERVDSGSSSVVRSIRKKQDLDKDIAKDIKIEIVICEISFEKTSCFKP